jgi:hypothetical protein
MKETRALYALGGAILVSFAGVFFLVCASLKETEVAKRKELTESRQDERSHPETKPQVTFSNRGSETVTTKPDHVPSPENQQEVNGTQWEEVSEEAQVQEPPELKTPVLYSLHQERIARLAPEQQWAVSRIAKGYLEFYQRWSSSPAKDIAQWNEQADQLRQALLQQLGPEATDQLLR